MASEYIYLKVELHKSPKLFGSEYVLCRGKTSIDILFIHTCHTCSSRGRKGLISEFRSTTGPIRAIIIQWHWPFFNRWLLMIRHYTLRNHLPWSIGKLLLHATNFKVLVQVINITISHVCFPHPWNWFKHIHLFICPLQPLPSFWPAIICTEINVFYSHSTSLLPIMK